MENYKSIYFFLIYTLGIACTHLNYIATYIFVYAIAIASYIAVANFLVCI